MAMVRQYRGCKIYEDVDQETFYWENQKGVVIGEGFETIDECINDIDSEAEYAKKGAYIGDVDAY